MHSEKHIASIRKRHTLNPQKIPKFLRDFLRFPNDLELIQSLSNQILYFYCYKDETRLDVSS